jgi:hypothetical protein
MLASRLLLFINIGGQCHSFYLFLVHRLVMRGVHCTYSILLGVCLKWSGGLLVLICIDVIVVRVKVSRGFVPLPNGDRQCGH